MTTSRQSVDDRDAPFWWWLVATSLVVITVVLGVALDNAGGVEIGDLGRPLGILLAIGSGLCVACRVVWRPLTRVVPPTLFLFFAYGSFRRTLGSHLLATLFLLAVVAVIAIWLRGLPERRTARITLGIAAVMAAGSLIAVLPSLGGERSAPVDYGGDLVRRSNSRHGGAELPDILYLVPDRYASRTTLATGFDFDNEPFYRQLGERGFVVEPDGWANYPQTFQSLASGLNSTYLDEVSRLGGWAGWDRIPVFRMLEDNRLQERLRAEGYDYLHIAGWWEATRKNRHADENYLGSSDSGLARLWPSEFERALWAGTPLPILDSGYSRSDCTRLKRQLERLSEVGDGPRPLFVFAHLLVPHEPFLTDATGQCLEPPIEWETTDEGWEVARRAWVEYLRFFNQAALEIVDQQLERRPEGSRELVVVLQSDEGPYPRELVESELTDALPRLGPADLRRKLGIINAIRLPGASLEPIQLATPINNWRLVLNHVFGQELELLPHHSFIHSGSRRLYDFVEVSDVLRSGGTGESEISGSLE